MKYIATWLHEGVYSFICRLYSHLKANENYFLEHVYIYIYIKDYCITRRA